MGGFKPKNICCMSFLVGKSEIYCPGQLNIILYLLWLNHILIFLSVCRHWGDRGGSWTLFPGQRHLSASWRDWTAQGRLKKVSKAFSLVEETFLTVDRGFLVLCHPIWSWIFVGICYIRLARLVCRSSQRVRPTSGISRLLHVDEPTHARAMKRLFFLMLKVYPLSFVPT